MAPEQMTTVSPDLAFVATVALKLESVVSTADAPDGVHMQFGVAGTLRGPRLNGDFPSGTLAFLRVDADGVGTINVKAPLFLQDGARAELEATGRYDFGDDGYQKARRGPEHLPDSDLGWCPRLLTGDTRYTWLNGAQFLGVGRLVPSQRRVDYDLYLVRAVRAPIAGDGRDVAARPSLYERLGRREGIRRLFSVAIDSLHSNEDLLRQNPTLAAANEKVDVNMLKERVTDFFCSVTGGPCLYKGRTIRASHQHLGITEADWQVFLADTVKVMNQVGVGPTEQKELLALLGRSKAEIVKGS